MNLNVIYEDDAILVCHKPAGVATQSRRIGQQDMESLLRNYRAAKREEPYIGIVHRLDQPVEGVMVFAKTPKAAANLSAQVQNRTIGKHYYALVHVDEYEGPGEGTLDDYLVADRKQNIASIATAQTPQAKCALLDYQIVEKKQNTALVDILLHTGRQHQIRVQFAHAHMPLVGDQKYGRGKENTSLALCSYCLEFTHPGSGQAMHFQIVPQGAPFRPFLDNIGGRE